MILCYICHWNMLYFYLIYIMIIFPGKYISTYLILFNICITLHSNGWAIIYLAVPHWWILLFPLFLFYIIIIIIIWLLKTVLGRKRLQSTSFQFLSVTKKTIKGILLLTCKYLTASKAEYTFTRYESFIFLFLWLACFYYLHFFFLVISTFVSSSTWIVVKNFAGSYISFCFTFC